MGYPDEANRRPEMPRETELDAMSPSRLADAMERALDDMTEETYDPAALRACLEALERAAPVPPHAGAQDAARRVEDWIQQQGAPEEPERKPGGQSPARRRGLLRGGLAAALVTVCLFGAVAAAQAAGWNVFGAVARWTAETFSFGKLPEEREEPPAPSVPTSELPPEYEEMRAILEEDGQAMYFPQIPEGYELSYSDLYLDPLTGEADFAVEYRAGDTYIAYRAVQFGEVPVTVYEKDGTPMEEYEENGITHYIFQNNGNKTVAWISGWLECSIGTNDMSMDLRALIRSMY